MICVLFELLQHMFTAYGGAEVLFELGSYKSTIALSRSRGALKSSYDVNLFNLLYCLEYISLCNPLVHNNQAVSDAFRHVLSGITHKAQKFSGLLSFDEGLNTVLNTGMF
jgi:hypothetical protein